MTTNAFRRVLPVAMTYLYINLPLALFFWFWLKNPLAGAVVFVFTVYSVYQVYRVHTAEYNFHFTGLEILKIVCLCLVLVLVSGVSGVGGGSAFDISHHLQKVFDFSHSKLPIYYENASDYASYYYGFYIIPGLLLNFLGDITAVFFLWEWGGMFIGLSWLYLLMKRNFGHLVLLFLVSGLLSFLMPLFRMDNFFASPYFYFQDTRWNLLPMYLSLRWVPNQFIYTVILTGVVLYVKPRDLKSCSTLLISGLFWAPFPALVIGIIYCIRMLPHLKMNKKTGGFLLINGFLMAFIFLYLSANQTSNGFEFTLTSPGRILNYFSLIAFEVLVFFVLMEAGYRQRIELKVVVAMLLLLPLAKLGIGNDLFSRASLPLLLILYIYFIKSFSYKTPKQPYRIALMVLVSLLPLKYLAHNLSKFSMDPFYVPSKSVDTYELIQNDYQSKKVADQYLMDSNSIFYRFLLDKQGFKVLSSGKPKYRKQ